MKARVMHIAFNTFREAVRDRVLYNLIAFAVLLSGAAILVGQISIDIEKLVVINLGLTAVSLFGIVIAIFIGIGLVSKEIVKPRISPDTHEELVPWRTVLPSHLARFFRPTFRQPERPRFRSLHPRPLINLGKFRLQCSLIVVMLVHSLCDSVDIFA